MTPTLCQVTFPFGPLNHGFAKEILRNLSYSPSGSICSFHEHMARVHWRKLLARGTILTLPRFGISVAYKEPGGRKPHHLPHHFRCEREVRSIRSVIFRLGLMLLFVQSITHKPHHLPHHFRCEREVRKPHHLPHHFRCEREVLKAYHRPAVWEDKPQRSYSGRNPTEWLRFDACCWTSSALALPSRNK